MTERNRATLNTLHVVSLTLAAVLAVLFVHSHWTAYAYADPTSAGGVWQVQLHGGGVYVLLLDPERSGGVVTGVWVTQPATDAHIWTDSNVGRWGSQIFFGAGFVRGNGYTAMRFPIWFFFAVLVLYMIWWLRHPQRKPRTRFGVCVNCGYDLRGCVERCSECGEPFSRAVIVAPPPPARSVKPDRTRPRPTDDTARSAEASASSPATDRAC